MQNLAFQSHVPLRPVLDAIRKPWDRLLRFTSRQTADGRLYVGQGEPVMVFPVFGGGPIEHRPGARRARRGRLHQL